MANWCNNYFSYEGPDSNKVDALFKRLAKKERDSQEGQILKWFKDDRYLFDIYCEEKGSVTFETKWAPAEDTIVSIFNRYEIWGVYEYAEPGMGVYGRIIQDREGSLTEVQLDDSDLAQFEYDENLDAYIYNGEQYESDYEIIEDLLNKKQYEF